MTDPDQILKIIYEAIDNLNALMPAERRLAKSPDSVLTGNDSVLDSLGLVNFIVAVERGAEEKLGLSVNLVNEDSMARKESPFRTVASLADYLSEWANKNPHGTS